MKLLERADLLCRRRGMSGKTARVYCHWIRRYLAFCAAAHGEWVGPEQLGTADVEAFLNHLVGERRLAVEQGGGRRPLGQGVATSVGMAVASKWQAAHFNRPGFELFDFDVYAKILNPAYPNADVWWQDAEVEGNWVTRKIDKVELPPGTDATIRRQADKRFGRGPPPHCQPSLDFSQLAISRRHSLPCGITRVREMKAWIWPGNSR